MTRPLRGVALTALVAILLGVTLVAARPAPASAHPLGNFTVNTYSRIELYADAIRIRYVLDMAEIPAFQERQRIDTNADGVVTSEESSAYVTTQLPALLKAIELTIDGDPIALETTAATLAFEEGEAGLETLRLAFWLDAPVHANLEAASVLYIDANYRDRLGWRELIVQPNDSALTGAVPTDDPTNELHDYPADQLQSPRITEQLAFTYTPGATPAPAIPATAPAAAQPAIDAQTTSEASSTLSTPSTRGGFEALIAPEHVTVSLAVIALLAAAAFGAVHALEPGHGKTLVAAYFVGTRGTAPQAVLLGLIVAATHTVGVSAIGTVTLVGSKYILPEDLYPWLSAASGLVLAAIGFALLRPRLTAFLPRRLARKDTHEPEPHGHHHRHGPGGHTHASPATPEDGPPWGGLIALGLADGLVPTPSTLVVLLAAVSLDRTPLGLALIAAFSLGFGAVLTALALAFVYARRWFTRVAPERSGLGLASGFPIAAALPVVAALLLVGVGLTLSARSLAQAL